MDCKEFYDQVKIGDLIPPLRKPTVFEGYRTPQIFGGIELAAEPIEAQEAAESRGVDSIHTSKLFAGPFLLQFISEMITNWLPNVRGWVEGGKLSAKFTKPVSFGGLITCKGRVKEKVARDAKAYLICEVWIENSVGDSVVIGEAHIAF